MNPTLLRPVLAALLFALSAGPVRAADPAGTPAPISATDTTALLERVGTEVVVEGDVIRTSESKSGINFLNFQQAMRSGFVVVTFAKDLQNFPDGKPKDRYLRKRVRITGTVEKYKDQPQIVLKAPGQIQVLGPLPEPSPTPATPAPQ